MSTSYLTVILEVAAHVFRSIGASAVLLPFTYFVGSIALDMCNGLSVILGAISVASAILAVAVTYMELEQAIEEVGSFRYWRATIQNM